MKFDLERKVVLKKEARDGILSYCKMKHPSEGILILRGKSKKGVITINGLVIPPFSYSDQTFAGFPQSFLPLDLSYVGSAHSHPSGSAEPSVTDLHNFFGLVSIIVKSPYEENEDIFAWDSEGNQLEIIFEGDGEEKN
ncbi:MAG: Mov34/MPN/PAD-1 family protein [Thermoproteota archaeon]|jgi:proteasome lid subunit RPN8/RPN11|nr:Mov34/MPN/PAD-1 family protein [Candidatus Nitrosotenuis sp.]